MWKNIVESGRPQMTVWRMRIACWITKATNTQSEYEILIAIPRQQWLHGRGSVLHYMFTECPVFFNTSRPTMGPTLPPTHWRPSLLPRNKEAGACS
jgi:hypothetical protein